MEINTLDDVIYMKMKNDLSFLISGYLVLFEQQSSYNPNMPLREFLYCGNLFSKYIEDHKLNIYGRKLIKLPTPQCYVFYNGTDIFEDQKILKLSDAFECESGGGYEWSTTMININQGHNSELMEQCLWLKKYSDFVTLIRDYCNWLPVEEAVDETVSYFIREGDAFGKLLERHRAEVKEVCITEFNEQVFIDGIREEGLEIGLKNIVILLKPSTSSVDEIYSKVRTMEGYENVTLEQIQKLYEQNK